MPDLLQHLFDSEAAFHEALPALVAANFFPDGVPLGKILLPVQGVRVSLLPPLLREAECRERGASLERGLLLEMMVGAVSYQAILGMVPALTAEATLLLCNGRQAREYAAIMQMRLRPQVRLARLFRRLTQQGETGSQSQARLAAQKEKLLHKHNQQYGVAPTAEEVQAIDVSADLANYETRSLGDLLQDGVRIALSRVCKYWQEYPVQTEAEVQGFLLPSLPSMFTPLLQRSLRRSGLLQPLDTHNPLAELAHKRKVTFCGAGGIRHLQGSQTPERLIHPSQKGCLCPVETTESARIGLTLHLAVNATEQRGSLIAGTETLGVSAALIPFVEHNDMNRAMMGAKNMKQALPLLAAEPPLVQTGMEERVVREGGMHPGPAVRDGLLALGVNLLVAYLPWYGYNFEDAIVVSDRAADQLTSWHANPETGGQERRLQVGDKLTGRHGNKGVVSRILPVSEMPQLPDGQAVDVLLNPHGVISRMNIGQLLETHWGWVAQKRAEPVLVPPFQHAARLDALDQALAASRLPGGRACLTWIGPEGQSCCASAVVGVQYLMKLDHCAADKLQVRTVGRRTRITRQPPRGRSHGDNATSAASDGGQRAGEMEIWALQAHGARLNLEEMLGLKSDVFAHDGAALPESLRAFLFHVRALGMDVRLHSGPEDASAEVPWDRLLAEGNPVIAGGNPVIAGGNPVIAGGNPVIAGGNSAGQLAMTFAWAEEQQVRSWAAGREVRAADYERRGWECPLCGVIIPTAGKRMPSRGRGQTPLCPNGCGSDLQPAWIWEPEGLMGRQVFGTHEAQERLQGGCIPLPAAVPHPLASDSAASRLLRVIYVLPPALRPLSPQDDGLNRRYRAILLAAAAYERHETRQNFPNAHGAQRLSTGDGRTLGQDRAWRALVQAVAALFGRRATFEAGLIHYHPVTDEAERACSVPARLEGKSGLLRGYLLGKRCDYSGRAVIVPEPNLPFGHCRLPEKALAAFADTSLADTSLLTEPQTQDRKQDQKQDRNWPPTFPILLNRAPTLHRYGLLAYEAEMETPSGGPVLALHPLACGGFGADFDGDTMAFHLALSREAQEEARLRMSPARHLFSASNGQPLLHIAQDIVAGIYLFTATLENGGRDWLSALLEDDALAKDSGPVSIRELLPVVARFLRRAQAENNTIPAEALDRLDRLMRRGFQEATERGLSFSIFDLNVLRLEPDVVRVTAALSAEADVMREALGERLTAALRQRPEGPISALLLSGARGDPRQLARLCGAVTRMPTGEPTACYLEGLLPEEYFEAAQEARRDMLPKKLGTPIGGDLTRKLVYGLYPQRIVAATCQDREGLALPATLLPHLLGRRLAAAVPARAGAGEILDEAALLRLDGWEGSHGRGEFLHVFSPLTCRSGSNVCARCYGWDLATGREPEPGLPIGLLAAQSIGERATQDFMKVFQGARGAVNCFEAAKGLLERGETSSLGAEIAAERLRDLSVPALLHWLAVQVYENKVNLHHFEVAFRVVRLGQRPQGLVAAARNRIEQSPLAAMAFQSPTRVLIQAAQAGLRDTLTVGAAPLFLGRMPGQDESILEETA